MTKYQRFEEEKKQLKMMNLPPKKYTEEIIKLCKKLKI